MSPNPYQSPAEPNPEPDRRSTRSPDGFASLLFGLLFTAGIMTAMPIGVILAFQNHDLVVGAVIGLALAGIGSLLCIGCLAADRIWKWRLDE